jgi:isochorismate synthase
VLNSASNAASPAAADSQSAHHAPWLFGLAGPEQNIFATGLARKLPPGPADSLAARVQRFFAESTELSGAGTQSAPEILVGAMPFDRMADDFLYQPATLSAVPSTLSTPHNTAASEATWSDAKWDVRPHPTRDAYKAAVTQALARIAASREAGGDLTKLVLSRSLVLESDTRIDPTRLWAQLNVDPNAVRFLTYIGSGRHGEDRHLVGATPELLIRKSGAHIRSCPLAGSARRQADRTEDDATANALAHSGKDTREHRWVVEAILDGLSPLCSELSAPNSPSLVSTQTMWHLATDITGSLKHPDETSAAALAAILHPTPAVGGTPRDQALELIPQLEGYDRGFYAGAVGWTDAAGDGAWYVSLRCAEVSGNAARVYAGAGIVEGSTPEAEADETSAKLLAILRALGIDEHGYPIG